MKGDIVYQQNAKSTDMVLDVSFLKEGFYLLSVSDGFRHYTKILNIIR